MVVSIRSRAWAEAMFGGAELGHRGRTKRLVKVAGDLADDLGASIAGASGDDAAVEGAYRLARNKRVAPERIAAAGFCATAMQAKSCETVLALEDTTSLTYWHSIREELGDIGGRTDAPARGFFVHSVLLVDAKTTHTIGLAAQHYWTRDIEQRGKRKRGRPYETRESFKWQRATESLRETLGNEQMKRVISVCDREADLYEYLSTKITHGERFVVRACFSRGVDGEGDGSDGYLWPVMLRARRVAHVMVAVLSELVDALDKRRWRSGRVA